MENGDRWLLCDFSVGWLLDFVGGYDGGLWEWVVVVFVVGDGICWLLWVFVASCFIT